MTPTSAGTVRGVPIAWASFARDSTQFVVFASSTVALCFLGLFSEMALGILFGSALSMWSGAPLVTQLSTRIAGHAISIMAVSGKIHPATRHSWISGSMVMLTPTENRAPGDTVTCAVGADTRATFSRIAGRGCLPSVPCQDHIVLHIGKGGYNIHPALYIRPSQAWIDTLVSDLEAAGLRAELDR